MDKYNHLFQEIFKQPLSNETNIELLKKTTRDYPYFTPAHFFLLHFTERSSPAFAKLAQITTPLFNNAYWLNFQLLELNQETSVNQLSGSADAVVTEEEDSRRDVQIESPVNIAVDIIETNYASKNSTDLIEVDTLLTSLPTVQLTGSEISEPTLDIKASEKEVSDDFGVASKEPEAYLQPEIINDGSTVGNRDNIEDTEAIFAEPALENEVLVNKEFNHHIDEEPVYTEAEMDANEALQNDTDLPVAVHTPLDAEMEQVSIKMAETLAGLSLNNNTVEDKITFEPLHSSDYFASVGIKLSEEVKPADKLGLQLKSFTEWLKTMKKVHAEQLGDSSTSETSAVKIDKTIQELAEASNKENEIITEAMADVFEQQGKTGKAIEVYEKLSLLNPSKKVYFAAKINQLKD